MSLYASAIPKGRETYVVCYDSDHFQEAMMAVGHWAENPALNFSWEDCLAITRQIEADIELEKLLSCSGR